MWALALQMEMGPHKDMGKSHPGQSFPLSLCGPISICRANAHMVYGLKHQHFTSHSITTIHSQLQSMAPLSNKVSFPAGWGLLHQIAILGIGLQYKLLAHAPDTCYNSIQLNQAL